MNTEYTLDKHDVTRNDVTLFNTNSILTPRYTFQPVIHFQCGFWHHLHVKCQFHSHT